MRIAVRAILLSLLIIHQARCSKNEVLTQIRAARERIIAPYTAEGWPQANVDALFRISDAVPSKPPPQCCPYPTTWVDKPSRAALIASLRAARVGGRPWTIAIAGASVTAGFGNFHNESYPLILERMLAPTFAAAGVTLHVRNVANGGISSFSSGLCASAVLGRDPDVVAWDFKQTDGRDYALSETFLRRGARLPSSPVLGFFAPTLGREHAKLALHLAKGGVATHGLSLDLEALAHAGVVPFTKSDAHAATLPEGLRWLHCDGLPAERSVCKPHW